MRDGGAGAAVRDGSPADLEEVGRIQRESPEAAQWPPADYLGRDFRVAVLDGRVAGFYVARPVAGESELLNLAVAPELRRKGVGKRLMEDLLERRSGAVYLEVRSSNQAARNFYELLGFQEVNRRTGYYSDPPDDAVVMKNSSCYCHK